MRGLARIMDMVGTGVIQNTKVTSVICEGRFVSTLGDTVSTHGEAPHVMPPLVLGTSATVVAEGQPVCIQGTTAICGHSVSMGSTTVKVGS